MSRGARRVGLRARPAVLASAAAAVGFAVALAAMPVAAQGAPGGGAPAVPAVTGDDVASLRARLDEARAVYATDAVRAREMAGEAFMRFESSGIDKSLATRDPSAYKDLESTWLKLVSAMRARAPQGEIDALHGRLVAQLGAASPSSASGAGAGALFANSLLIILREGFEAILILSAVGTALRASGQVHGVRPLRAGAVFAIVASLGLAAAAASLGGMSGSGREALEGVTCLVAVVVLFLTSYWLISRVEGRRWQAFIRDSVRQAASENRRGGLFALSFLVVFREGFETVLFYQALAVEAGTLHGGMGAVISGFAAGLALLVVLWAGIHWFGMHVPMRQFFAVTGGLLYLLAIKFAGVGIRELQEAGWLVPAPVGWFPEVAWLRDWIGVVPDLQVLAAQGVLVLAVIGGLIYARTRGDAGVARAARHAA